MKELSRIALAVEPSSTLEIDAMFKQMKAEGQDVIGFGAGEPDFPTPDYIKDAARQAIRNNETRYTPAIGAADLRKAICSRLEEDCGLRYDHTQVVVSNGVKHCIYLALQALIDPGDEVILPAPYWVSYIELIRMVGGVPVILETTEADHFKIRADRLRDLITPKTKCMIINNPCNPTGKLYSRQELTEVAQVCLEKDIYVISDEIYYRLVYDNQTFVSFAALGEEIKKRTLLVNGVSKSYAMTGWRIGYVAANPEVTRAIANYCSHSTGSPCSISQRAAVTALSMPQDSVETMRRDFEARRNYMVERINQIPAVSCLKPEGAFYVMMNISRLIGKKLYGTTINNADDFGALLLRYGKVAVVPGGGFGAPMFIRWSYAVSMDNIREGMDRLEKFLAEGSLR